MLTSDVLATALVLLSAILHASWNAWLKMQPDKLALNCFYAVFGGFAFLPVVIYAPWPTASLWVYIVASTAVHVCYQLCLLRVLERTDLTIGYPIARGTGPLIVAVASLFLWPGTLSVAALCAIGLIVAGIMLAGVSAAWRQGKPLHRVPGVPVALLCGAFIGSYTLIDAAGVRHAAHFLGFVGWLNVLFAPAMLGVAYAQRGREVLVAALGVWRVGLPITVLAVTGYTAVLFAMRIGTVGEIAALRETSIVFAALIGHWLLREALGRTRLLSILMISVGAVALKVA